MLYRLFSRIPSDLSGQVWEAFAKNSLYITLIISLISAIIVIFYLNFRYKIYDYNRPYSINTSFWLFTVFFIIFHTVLIFWFSSITFGVDWLDTIVLLSLSKGLYEDSSVVPRSQAGLFVDSDGTDIVRRLYLGGSRKRIHAPLGRRLVPLHAHDHASRFNRRGPGCITETGCRLRLSARSRFGGRQDWKGRNTA